MKQPKKLTLRYKKILTKNGLVPNNWMLVQDLGNRIVIINKSSRKTKELIV